LAFQSLQRLKAVLVDEFENALEQWHYVSVRYVGRQQLQLVMVVAVVFVLSVAPELSK
jgi:hypothetical protein